MALATTFESKAPLGHPSVGPGPIDAVLNEYRRDQEYLLSGGEQPFLEFVQRHIDVLKPYLNTALQRYTQESIDISYIREDIGAEAQKIAGRVMSDYDAADFNDVVQLAILAEYESNWQNADYPGTGPEIPVYQ